MNLRGFLKQTVRYERKADTDEWGSPSYEPEVTVPARIEEKQKLVRDGDGTEVLATTRVLLLAEPEPRIGDHVNGQDVQARESIVDVGGTLLGWTVYL